MQVLQGSLRALITDVLFLAIIHHRGFQAGTKAATHFQPFRRLGYVLPPTLRTGHPILAHFDHFRFDRRQFSDLVHRQKQSGFRTQVCLAFRTTVQPHFHDIIRISHELPLMLRVTGRRTMSPFAPLFGLTALLISGGWL